jgi:16S rRNA (guanine966-N2)-methyltransferase
MRITGGVFRSRALRAPRGQATRPTTDKVREALFSMLAADGALQAGGRVLDLYAGSGALAFEALSRGASAAVVVEHARDAVAVIRENSRALGAEARVSVVPGRVERAVLRLEGPFDVVFVDPPYAEVRQPGFAGVLAAAARLMAADGTLVLEHASTDEPPEAEGLALDRSRRHGDTTLSIYRSLQGPAL